MESYSHSGIVWNELSIIHDFYASDTFSAVAKLSRLIEKEYSYVHGKIIELSNS